MTEERKPHEVNSDAEPSRNADVSSAVDAFDALNRIIETTDGGERRAVYKGASAFAHKNWPSLANGVEDLAREGPLPFVIAWGALELAAHDAVLKATKGQSLRRLLPVVRADIADAFVRTFTETRLLARDLEKEMLVDSEQRRRMLALPSVAESPIGHDATEEPSSNLRTVILEDATVAALAEAGAQVSAELCARRQLEELIDVAAETDRAALKRLRLGIRALERALDSAVTSWKRHDGEIPLGLWDRITNPVLRVGRSPDVWHALGPSRKRLLSFVPASPGVQKQWAWLVAATWVSDKIGDEALHDWPVTLVPQVYLAAVKQNVRGLSRRIIARMEASSNDVVAELRETLQPLLEEEAPQLAALADVARRAVLSTGGLDAVGTLPEVEQPAAIYELIQSSSQIDAIAEGVLAVLASLPPQAALPSLAVLLSKLRDARHERVLAALTDEIARMETLRRDTTVRLRQLGSNEAIANSFVGKLVLSFDSVCALWTKRLSVRATDCAAPESVTSYQIRPEEAAEILEAEVEQLRRSLHQDGLEPHAHRRRLISQVAWLVEHDSARLRALTDRAASLPEEAQALLWEVGIRTRCTPLLDAVSFGWRMGGWGRRATEELMLRYVGERSDPVAVDDTMAGPIADGMRERVNEILAQMTVVPIDPDIGEARQALGNARAELRQIFLDLRESLKDVLT